MLQVAACFVLGASGVALGTRLVATTESLYKDSKKQHIVQTGSQASERPTTLRTTLYDELNEDVRWPSGVTARAIRNDFTDQWDGQTPLQVGFAPLKDPRVTEVLAAFWPPLMAIDSAYSQVLGICCHGKNNLALALSTLLTLRFCST